MSRHDKRRLNQRKCGIFNKLRQLWARLQRAPFMNADLIAKWQAAMNRRGLVVA